jgi:hypothetical protein
VYISGNAARGKVVFYDATNEDDGRDVVYTGCTVDLGCFPSDDPKYQTWLDVGKPKCWCCLYHDQGDATGDGKVNIFDLIRIKAAYGEQYPSGDYDCTADFTHDGKVNIFDLIRLKGNYGDNYGYSCPTEWKNDCGPNP